MTGRKTSITVRDLRVEIFTGVIAGTAGLTFDELADHRRFRAWTAVALATALGDALVRDLIDVDDDGRVRSVPAPGHLRQRAAA